MKEINISEKKPNHIKAFLGVGIIVLFVVFLTAYYQVFVAKRTTQEQTLPETNSAFSSFLAQSVNATQTSDETLPPEARSLIGVWEGAWMSSSQKIPTALVVKEVIPSKGISISYKTLGDASSKMIPVEVNLFGNLVLLSDKEDVVALEFIFPQFEDADPVQIHFWFPNDTATDLKGSFIDPRTRKTITGEFKRVR